jgi:phospholipid N-methyltransferase
MEWVVFCRRFLHNPSCIGSVIPSSRYLARKVADSVMWEDCDIVVELGAGTGSFTKYLVANKPSKTKIVLFEKDPVFRAQLKEMYQTIPLYDDAARLTEILAKEGIGRVDCVVSGLPFAMFSAAKRRSILSQVQGALPKDGQFITFQYSPQMYWELCLYFTKVRVGFTLLNVPPAIVYTCRR